MRKTYILIIIMSFICTTLAQNRGDLTVATDMIIDWNEECGKLTVNNGVTLTIADGGELTVTKSIKNNGSIIIEEGGQLITTLAGQNIIVKKNLEAHNNTKWYAISAPVDCSITTPFTSFTDYDLYYYDEPAAFWRSYKDNVSNTQFTNNNPGRGYLCAVEADKTLSFTGNLIKSVSAYAITNSSTTLLKGFNLIGNPYTHKIYKGWTNQSDACAIASQDLASGYYKLSGSGSWTLCNYEVPINPCEGILIKTRSEISLVIDNNTLEANSDSDFNPFGVKGNNKELEITIAGNSGEDRTYAYFYNGIGLDKIEHMSEKAPSLSIRYEDTDYAIAHVDENSNLLDVIFKNNQSGFFTLSVNNEKANFKYLHLIDNLTGEDIDMLAGKSYKFYAFGNEDENRFKIVLNPNTDSAEASTFAYVSNDDIIITGLDGNATLQIFDVMGRMVSAESITGTNGMVSRSHKPATAGVYVLRLITNNGMNTQKIVIE